MSEEGSALDDAPCSYPLPHTCQGTAIGCAKRRAKDRIRAEKARIARGQALRCAHCKAVCKRTDHDQRYCGRACAYWAHKARQGKPTPLNPAFSKF